MADVLLPQSRLLRFLVALLAGAWILLGIYLAFLHSDAPRVLSPVAEAAERTAAHPGYRVEIAASVQGVPGVGPLQMRGSGAVNGKTGRSQLELRTYGAPSPPGDFTITQITDGDTFYMALPALGSLAGGKPWMKLELSDLGTAGSGSADPKDQLSQLRSVAGSVQPTGTETVRGVPCTHYVASVDLGREAEQLRDEGKDEAADAIEELLDAGQQSTIPTEVWIDTKGFVRRQTISIPFGFLGAGAAMSMQMDLFAFGAEPRISPPPSSQVFDASGLAEQALEGVDA